MSVITQPAWNTAQVPSLPVRRFTVDEYHRMIQAGILTEDDPVELLRGWIVTKMARNPPHDGTIDLAQEVIRGRLPTGWRIRVQSAITTDDSEPEPDLVIVPGPANRYMQRHPGPQDIAVVIEVADSSLARDRDDKGPMYALANISVYWIINLVDLRVEVYSDPSGPDASPGYRRHQDYGRNDSVPLVIAGQEVGHIAVRELLP